MAGVRCYFSGIESSLHFQHCVNAKVKHVLTSFWQFHDKDTQFVKRRKKKHPQMEFMVDSGAHTFITDWQKFTSWSRKDFDNYVEKYVRWIVDNRKYISCAVEFDIDFTLNMILGGNQNSTIGPSIVSSWQDSLFRPLEKKGIEIIYVWHVERGMDGWEDMCAKFSYVGLPGNLSSDADFNKYMSIARRYCTKTHGFAATKMVDFRDVEWFSIDSITWKTGEMYGTLIDWNANTQKLTFISDKTQRHKLRRKLLDLGFDADAIIADTNYKEVTRYGLFSMRQMEAFYEQRYSSRTRYYELRLPHPSVIPTMTGTEVMRWWQLFRPDETFKQHAGQGALQVKDHLRALSAVQNADVKYLSATPDAISFLKAYFPKLVDPLPTDPRILQRELAVFTAPRNPPPLERTDPLHWEPQISPPKLRTDEPIDFADLDFARPEDHFLSRML